MPIAQEENHLYWKRPRKLDPGRFHAFALDVERLARASLYGVDLARCRNPLQRELVFLNGCCNDHRGEVFLISADKCEPGTRGQGASDILIESCRHKGLPYSIVARAALLAFKLHFGAEVEVIYDNNPRAWARAWDLYSEAVRGRELTREEYENFQTMIALGGEVTTPPYDKTGTTEVRMRKSALARPAAGR